MLTAKLRRAGALLTILAALLAIPALTATPAVPAPVTHIAITHASAAPVPARPVTARLTAVRTLAWGGSRAGNAALNWAEGHAYGHWYCWAGAGPACYDCSGLAMAAFGHATGIWLPHSTYSMLASPHLHRVYAPQRGDLAFFSTGHVELVTVWYHTTFGAHHSGTRVGWRAWSSYYHPTMYFRVW